MNRTDLNQKISRSLRERQVSALVAFGADNFQYLTGVSLPFLFSISTHQPVVTVWTEQEAACVAPSRLASSLSTQGWSGRILTYPASEEPADTIAQIVAGLLAHLPADGNVAVDLERATVRQIDALQRALPGQHLTEGDTHLCSLRVIKTADEIELLDRLAVITDHGVAGAMHHVSVLGGRTEKYMSEDLRVHCLERGTELYGYHALSQTASGLHAKRFWPLSPRFGFGQEKKMEPGEAVRMEMRAVLDGYWSDAARTLTMGQPTRAQEEGYGHLRALTQAAVRTVQPGKRACEVYTAVAKKAKDLKAEWIGELGVGHGVGVTPYEAPFLSEWNQMELAAGMVMVIDISVKLSTGEILRGKETVIVTDTGCRTADTYHDWRTPYIAALTF